MKKRTSESRLADVYVTRTTAAPPDPANLSPLGSGPCGCFKLHRVEWQESRRNADGTTVCRFRAPDAESVRIALRQAGIPFDSISTRAPGP